LKRRCVIILAVLCTFFSCNKIQKASLDDVTSKEEVNIVRLDIPESEFIISGSDMSAQEMAMLLPQGVKNLYEDVLNIGSVSEPDVADAFRNYFIQDSARMHLVRDVEARFKDLSGLSKELGTLFGRLQKEVPEVDIPTFYTQISGFNQSIVVGDSIVGISLDKYMGADYAPYRKIFYRQQIAQMEPSRIAADCLTFWLTSEFPPPPPGKSSLLDQMIHYGKLNWAVYRLTEGQPDDYTYSLINNKEDNGHVWKKISKALLTPRYLTTTNERTVRTIMFGPPAHHQAFGSSLRATGIVAGVKIVDEYMKRHPSCTLKQLLTDTSSRKIFEGAGYSIR
jgi:hypothetical protein